MSDVAPAVSVVVATHNRAALIERLVDALRLQKVAGRLEVVVVDDGSTDDTPTVLARLQKKWSPLHTVRLDSNRGPASARNAGWLASQAPLIAFTDDDCLPQHGWLASLAQALQQTEIAQGRTVGNPTQVAEGWFAWSPQITNDNGFYETCNIAYRRETLQAVGGFDEAFCSAPNRRRDRGDYIAPAWGEDTDLALRAKAAGARVTFASDALVWHDIKAGRMADRLRDLPRRGGVVAALRRHPELRQNFESRWFIDRAHAYVLGAVAGTILVATRPLDIRRWLAGAALGMPWVRARGRYYGRRAWPRVLPQWLVVDIADVAIMAAASARERTLLL